MLKIRRPLGRLIFNMGIAIPGKTVFLIETAPSPICKYILSPNRDIMGCLSGVFWRTRARTLIARFMGPTWGPPGADRTQVGPMWAPWKYILSPNRDIMGCLSGVFWRTRARTLIASFMGPTWGPPGADRTQVGPMWAPWKLLSGRHAQNWNDQPVIRGWTTVSTVNKICVVDGICSAKDEFLLKFIYHTKLVTFIGWHNIQASSRRCCDPQFSWTCQHQHKV